MKKQAQKKKAVTAKLKSEKVKAKPTKVTQPAKVKSVKAKPAVKAKAKPVGTHKKPMISKARTTKIIAVQPPKATGPFEEIRKVLLRQKHALLTEAGILLENTLNPASEVFPDWTDQASVETDQNFVLRLREREQQLLRKIDDSIERIDGGMFGLCEACGEQISLKRLKVRPVTTLCIACKTQQEMDEKMRQE